MSGRMEEYAKRITAAFGEYGKASELAYNISAETAGEIIALILRAQRGERVPLDLADLAAKADTAREAGVRAQEAAVRLRAAWADLGKSLGLGKWRSM